MPLSLERLAPHPQGDAIRLWTVDEVPVEQRPGSWRRAVDEALEGFAHVHADDTGEPAAPAARIQRAALPGFGLCHLRAGAQHLQVAGTQPQHVLLACDSQHAWELAGSGATQPLRPGDVAVLPGGAEALLDFAHGIDATLVVADRAWIDHWLPGFEAATVVAHDRGWGRVLSTALREMQADFGMGLQLRRESLMDTLGALLAGSIAPHRQAAVKLDLVEQARRLCLQGLNDPALGVRQVAERLGVSVRTMERAFAGHGSTFVETVRHLRLDRAAALLEQPGFGDLPVGKVGVTCGFPSPSHFVREFHRRWGITPGQWRQRAVTLRTQAASVADTDPVVESARHHILAQRETVARLSGGSRLLHAQATDLLHQMERTLAAFEAHRDLLAVRSPAPIATAG